MQAELNEINLYEKEIGEMIECDAEFADERYKDDTFIIADFIVPDPPYSRFTAKGNIRFELFKGRKYHLSGVVTENVVRDTVYRQLELRSIRELEPQTDMEIVNYLQAYGLDFAKGCALYDEFGRLSLKMIRENPDEVARQVTGISKKKSRNLQKKVREAMNKSTDEVYTFFSSFYFSDDEIQDMIDEYGENLQQRVEENPYVLMNKGGAWPGASFAKCDKIAKEIGFDMNASVRIKAGIKEGIKREERNGHSYSTYKEVVKHAHNVLNVSGVKIYKENIEEEIEAMNYDGDIHYDASKDRVYSKFQYRYETEMAQRLIELAYRRDWKYASNPLARERMLDGYCKKDGITLEEKQREAVLRACDKKGGIFLLNGGAGTGKTFTLKIILDLYESLFYKDHGRLPYVQCMAPTGKAAKVMRGSTGKSAVTIHRALEWTKTGFKRTASNPLEADVIVADEWSMADNSLAFSLMNAVKQGTLVILLGDPNQLPSIGAGNVLKDMIDSKAFINITLNVVKRQGEGSPIAENASRIIDQKLPVENQPHAYVRRFSTEQMLAYNVERLLERAIKSDKIDTDEVQVLSPIKNGPAGVNALNYKLKRLFNPDADGTMVSLNKQITVDGKKVPLNFEPGDRVINTKNSDQLTWLEKDPRTGDYMSIEEDDGKKMLTNGEIGTVRDIYKVKKTEQSRAMVECIVVEFEDGYVQYKGSKQKEHLDHAYAMTIHKSQGSQWDVVMQVLPRRAAFMTDNSLFYTGYTRAKNNSFLLSEQDIMRQALATRKSDNRRTSLDEFIEKEHNRVNVYN